jgi:HD superfamily phosphohydrolase
MQPFRGLPLRAFEQLPEPVVPFPLESGAFHFSDSRKPTSEELAQLCLSKPQQQFVCGKDFQRVTEISQMNIHHSGAECHARTSRAIHSLQAMMVGRNLLEHLLRHASDRPSYSPVSTHTVVEKNEALWVKTIEWIMLLHDIAHPPFGHLGERVQQAYGAYLIASCHGQGEDDAAQIAEGAKYFLEFDHDARAIDIISDASNRSLMQRDGVDPELVKAVICGLPSSNPLLRFFTDLKDLADRISYLQSDILHLNGSSNPTFFGEGVMTRYGQRQSLLSDIVASFRIYLENPLRPTLYSQPEAMQNFIDARADHYRKVTYTPMSQFVQHRLMVTLLRSFIDFDRNPLGAAGINPSEFATMSEPEVVKTLDDLELHAHDLASLLDYHIKITVDAEPRKFQQLCEMLNTVDPNAPGFSPDLSGHPLFPVAIAKEGDDLAESISVFGTPPVGKSCRFNIAQGSHGERKLPFIDQKFTPNHLSDDHTIYLCFHAARPLAEDRKVLAHLLNFIATNGGRVANVEHSGVSLFPRE